MRVLHLERVHWQSTVWVDGREAGKGDSLGTPHEFDLGELTPGKHVLTLRIDNRIGDGQCRPAEPQRDRPHAGELERGGGKDGTAQADCQPYR